MASFPVVLPFLFLDNVVLAKIVSRGVALAMLFIGGLALGRYAGYGSWKAGLVMVGLGAGLVAAINALGGWDPGWGRLFSESVLLVCRGCRGWRFCGSAPIHEYSKIR